MFKRLSVGVLCISLAFSLVLIIPVDTPAYAAGKIHKKKNQRSLTTRPAVQRSLTTRPAVLRTAASQSLKKRIPRELVREVILVREVGALVA
jgi:hypothetical protein